MVEMNPSEITGTLAVWIKLTTTKNKTTGLNHHWRVEMMKGTKLKMIDSADGKSVDINPSPYCELYWKGPGMKDGELQDIMEWTLIGFTGCKECTIEPVFSKDKDNSLFELPPIWTKETIPRGQYDGHVQEGGGWVARNQMPDTTIDTVLDADQQKQKQKKIEFNAPTQSREELISMRALVKYNELIGEEVGKRLEVLKLIAQAEERDRKAMAKEEKLQRKTLVGE